MNNLLENELKNMTAHRDSRQKVAVAVVENPAWIPDLLQIGLSVSSPNANKALWVLELVFLANIELLLPHLDFFCANLKHVSHQSALRPASKIIMLLLNADCKHHYSISKNKIKF